MNFPAAVRAVSPHVVRIPAVNPIRGNLRSADGAAPATLGRLAPLELLNGRVTSSLCDRTVSGAQYSRARPVPAFGDRRMPSRCRRAVPHEYTRASKTYDSHFANVIAPGRAVVTLDGDAIAETSTPTADRLWRRAASSVSGGMHKSIRRARSDRGYGSALHSYRYPGGWSEEDQSRMIFDGGQMCQSRTFSTLKYSARGDV